MEIISAPEIGLAAMQSFRRVSAQVGRRERGVQRGTLRCCLRRAGGFRA